jgi:cytochrome c oxidase subunit II
MHLERRVIAAAAIFVASLTLVIGLTVRLLGITVPDCLPNAKPFRKGEVIERAPKRYEIHLVAKMWAFDPPEITLPTGSTAEIFLATPDVTHGMQIMRTNVNIMAVPGAVNYARVRFDKPGDYQVICNEYCGIAHHSMAGMIHVTDTPVVSAATPSGSLATGAKLMDDNGCTACHSIDGSPSGGPTFKGLYGSKRELADGSTVIADDAYLIEAILHPDAKIVKGFEPVMPPLEVSPADQRAMIEYLKTLK